MDCWEIGEQEAGLDRLVAGLLEHQVPISETVRAEIAVVAEVWGMWTALAPGLARCLGNHHVDPRLRLIEHADTVPLPGSSVGTDTALADLLVVPWIACTRCGQVLARAHAQEPWGDLSYLARHYVLFVPGRSTSTGVFAPDSAWDALTELDVADLDAPLIGAFLHHLEADRGNGVRTRNARLAAIHSLFRHAALQRPEDAEVIARVLAIPPKRFDRTLVTYLTEEEINALLEACDQGTRTGRRDHALLMLACQTGLRASELTGLTVGDVHLGTGPHISCLGKGRKQRITPLAVSTVATLKNWMNERGGLPSDPLFPARRGEALSRDGLERRITKHAATATRSCPTLLGKKVSPHVMRHSAAMRLLHAGVDTAVIALRLGHENVATTQIYIHAVRVLIEVLSQVQINVLSSQATSVSRSMAARRFFSR